MDFGSTAAAALRHAVRWVAALLLAGSVMVIFAGPAAAHARLVSTAPEQGAVLAVAPTQVVLRFTETVRLGPDLVPWLRRERITDERGGSPHCAHVGR